MIESIEQHSMTLELNDPLVQAALDANKAYHKATEGEGGLQPGTIQAANEHARLQLVNVYLFGLQMSQFRHSLTVVSLPCYNSYCLLLVPTQPFVYGDGVGKIEHYYIAGYQESDNGCGLNQM